MKISIVCDRLYLCLCMCPTYNCTKDESEFTCSSTNIHILYFQCYIIKILALCFIEIASCIFYTISVKMLIYIVYAPHLFCFFPTYISFQQSFSDLFFIRIFCQQCLLYWSTCHW